MIDAVQENGFTNGPAVLAAGPVVWLPRERMVRYQWAKVIGAAFFVVIFAGWLFIQWSNPMMRAVAAGLLLLTAWLTIRSVITDAVRARGRGMSIEDGVLRITSLRPGGSQRLADRDPLGRGCEGEQGCRLDDVAIGEWREETLESLGLWLLDTHGRALVHIDRAFLADQAEARIFLGWLRKHSAARFDVTWLAVTVGQEKLSRK